VRRLQVSLRLMTCLERTHDQSFWAVEPVVDGMAGYKLSLILLCDKTTYVSLDQAVQ